MFKKTTFYLLALGLALALGSLARAADFTMTDTAGKAHSLSQYKGKWVLVNFWATWCPPCRREMPYLQAMQEQYGDQGLVVLAINLDESPATIRSFLERYKIEKITVLLDPGQKTTERYRILPLPTTFFIGRDGSIRSKVEGEMDLNRTESETLRLLSQQ